MKSTSESMQPDQYGGYVKMQNNDNSSMINEHLNSQDLIEYLNNILQGKEYNDEKDEWEKPKVKMNYNNQIIEVDAPPLVNDEERKIMISFLKFHLNSNTYLSNLQKIEQINDVMIDVNSLFVEIYYRLRNRIPRATANQLWMMFDNSIYFGLTRGGQKVTLDAVSKMQTSVEHINNQEQQQQQKDKFKLF